MIFAFAKIIRKESISTMQIPVIKIQIPRYPFGFGPPQADWSLEFNFV